MKAAVNKAKDAKLAFVPAAAPPPRLAPLISDTPDDAAAFLAPVAGRRASQLEPLHVESGAPGRVLTEHGGNLLMRTKTDDGARQLAMGSKAGGDWAVEQLEAAVGLIDELYEQLERKRMKKRAYAIRSFTNEVAIAKLAALDVVRRESAAREAGEEMGWDPLVGRGMHLVATAGEQELTGALKRNCAVLQTALYLRDEALRALAASEVRREVDALDPKLLGREAGSTGTAPARKSKPLKAASGPSKTKLSAAKSLKAMSGAVSRNTLAEIDGKREHLTEDEKHALVAEIIAERSLTEAQASTMARRNMVTFDASVMEEAIRPERRAKECTADGEEIDSELRVVEEIAQIQDEHRRLTNQLEDMVRKKLEEEEMQERDIDEEIADDVLDELVDDVEEDCIRDQMDEEQMASEEMADHIDYSMLCDLAAEMASPRKEGLHGGADDDENAMVDMSEGREKVGPDLKREIAEGELVSPKRGVDEAKPPLTASVVNLYRKAVLAHRFINKLRVEEFESSQATF